MGINQRASVVMSDQEVMDFVHESRTATLATNGPTGFPHLVAMWYGVLDGRVCFETKAKSQKVVNMRRDPRATCMIEGGESYDQLRGVAIEGDVRIIDDRNAPEYWSAAESIFTRNIGPLSGDSRPALEGMMNKRVVVLIEPRRVRSWDHRKLGLPSIPAGGTTITRPGGSK